MKQEFVEERRTRLLEYVNRHNRASIQDLASILDTTEATIRRDVSYLEKQELVYRSYGGVLRRERPSIWQITSLRDRMGLHMTEKERIGKRIGDLIEDGDSIMIDSGSTTMTAARELREKKNLLFVSNAPAIVPLIAEDGFNKVILTGGQLMNATSSLVGPEAERTIKQYRVDKAVIGLTGILLQEGFFASVPQETEIKRLMLLNARETIVAADSSKIGVRALCYVTSFAGVDKLVTDNGIDERTVHYLEKEDVEVLVV